MEFCDLTCARKNVKKLCKYDNLKFEFELFSFFMKSLNLDFYS